MILSGEIVNLKQVPLPEQESGGLGAAHIGPTWFVPAQGATAPIYRPSPGDIVRLLDDSLATELVSMLQYKHHHFIASSLAAPQIAEEFLWNANEGLLHADRLANRIVQLGGEPDFAPDSLTQRSYSLYDDIPGVGAMVKANLFAERAVIESYCEIIALIGEMDAASRRLLEDIVTARCEHVEELEGWLAG